jgi:hypothetical protein
MNPTFGLLTIVLLLHFIGDFVLQTRWMAENKSRSFAALTAHVLTYGVTLWVGLLVAQRPLVDVTYFAGGNALVHFAVDAVTSRITTYWWKKQNLYAFFTTIGFDQFLHAVTLLWTVHFLLDPAP